MLSATSSALHGLAEAGSWVAAAANTASRAGLPGADGAPLPGGDDLVGATTGLVVASGAYSVNLAVLRTALEVERSLVDVLA